MFLLNDKQILEYCNRPLGQKIDIDPLREENLQHTSYYFRLGAYYWRRRSLNASDPLTLGGEDPYLDRVGELTIHSPHLEALRHVAGSAPSDPRGGLILPGDAAAVQ
jgi:hypothetical protein